MKEISSAFIKAQKEFAPALKCSTNPHFKSKYADLSACVEAVIDALNNNDIAMIQKTHECDSGVAVETVFIHSSGEMLSGGILHVPASKQDAPGYGSALTYARRYSLMSSCGIAPEDDDGNAASKKEEPKPAYKNKTDDLGIDPSRIKTCKDKIIEAPTLDEATKLFCSLEKAGASSAQIEDVRIVFDNKCSQFDGFGEPIK